MVSIGYFMIIKSFSFFEIPIFKATVAILLFRGKILKLRDRVRPAPDGSVNLPDGQREECARSAHVREFILTRNDVQCVKPSHAIFLAGQDLEEKSDNFMHLNKKGLTRFVTLY